MPASTPPDQRDSGRIEALPSGSLRVVIYAGTDALSKKRHYLRETVPLAKNATARQQKAAWATAERILQRLRSEIHERRNPRTKATVRVLLDRYFDPVQTPLRIGRTTRKTYVSYTNRHIVPLIGDVRLGSLDADVFDSFYAQLQRCREHCDGRPYTEHRTANAHDCDDKCRPHTCKPLGDATIRKIHTILSGALKKAVRWKWIGVSPISEADPPSAPPSDPHPPSAEQMSRILTKAFADPDWGVLVWLKMRTGARRGEICALTWNRLDLDRGSLSVETSIAQDNGTTWEKPTKTHHKRRIALTATDVEILRAYRDRRRAQADALGVTIGEDGRIFSQEPDHSTWLTPSTVSQRYARMCASLEINTSIKNLRHFSATELIAAGVDVRTVAGRLGHGGGGTTTLKVYSAFVSEVDQRAADLTSTRMPAPPIDTKHIASPPPPTAVPDEPTEPYERIAADIAGAIRVGIAVSGMRLPAMKTIAERYNVAPSTVHRAVELLKADGLVKASRGVPATVI